MKITINLYQSTDDNEWKCQIETSDSEGIHSKSWSVTNFCDALNLVSEHFPNTKLIGEDKKLK